MSEIQEINTRLNKMENAINEIPHTVQNEVAKIQTPIILKLGSALGTLMIILWAGGFAVWSWMFDYQFNFINGRIEKVEASVFTPVSETILNELRAIKHEYKIQGLDTSIEHNKKPVQKKNKK